jgi:hypothetical protein
MELVTVLRELWRRRRYAALVGALALLVAAAVAFRLPSLESRKYDVGVATTRIFLDTPKSQVLEVAPKGSETLAARANLIGNLMADGLVKAAIAKRAGLRPDDLEGVAEDTTGVQAETAPPARERYRLTTRVLTATTGDQLPIIDLEAQAPDAAAAAKLADSAVAGLRDYLDTKAASQQVANAKRLQVAALGKAQGVEIVRGPGIAVAIFGGLFIFAVGCAMILVISSIARGWREVEEEEYLTDIFEDDPNDAPAEDDSADMWTDLPRSVG